MADVEAKVKEIIMNKLGVEASQVTPAASFTNDLGADSLDTVELVMEFEKAFNLQDPGRRCGENRHRRRRDHVSFRQSEVTS